MKVTKYNESNLIGFSVESLSESIGTITPNDWNPTDCGGCACVSCGPSGCGGAIDCGTCDDPPSICPNSIGLISPQAQAH